MTRSSSMRPAPLGIEGRSAGTRMMSSSTGGFVTIAAALGTKGGGAFGSGKVQHYQGGSSFTVFSAQGRNPLINCKLCGKGIQKIYDKTVKGYVYACTGAHSSKLQLPKDESKAGLQLIHPFMVLQLFVPAGQHFTLELRFSDATNIRRKMYFSTSFNELKITHLHCQIPLSMVVRNKWVSLALHVADLFYNCFRMMSFRSIDVIVLGSVCKLRKIFTMRNRPMETDGASQGTEEALPQEHMFAAGVDAVVQVIEMSKLQSALGIEVPSIEGCGGRCGPESVLSARKLMLNNKQDNLKQVHVAFGSRVPADERADKVSSKEKDGAGKVHPKPLCARSATPDVSATSAAAQIVGTTKQEKADSSAPQDVPAAAENKKGKPTLKKKEEINSWKREAQGLASGKHGRKEVELAKVKEFRQQAARYEDSPPITPCGWERCASARGSDDMTFRVHTLFEKLGDYARVGELDEDKGEDNTQRRQPVAPSKEQQAEAEAEGLKFYQVELEKDFMLREENSASASDDDFSWCSESSGRASNAIKDLADFVKGAHMVSEQQETDGLLCAATCTEESEQEARSEELFAVHNEQNDHEDQDPAAAETLLLGKPSQILERSVTPCPHSPIKRSRWEQDKPNSLEQEDCEATSEDDLDLLYDPTLDCYYDPKTNRYYELK